jgi:hypothetical protein
MGEKSRRHFPEPVTKKALKPAKAVFRPEKTPHHFHRLFSGRFEKMSVFGRPPPYIYNQFLRLVTMM